MQVVARRRGDGDAASLETAVGGLCGEKAAQEFSGFCVFGSVDLERGSCGEGEQIGVLFACGLLGELLDMAEFCAEVAFVGFCACKGDVGVGDIAWSAPKGIECAGVSLVAALVGAFCAQPALGALYHLVIELRVDGAHIVELKESVSGEGFVSGGMAEPLEAFLLGFKLGEALVSAIKKGLGAAHDLWFLKALLFQEVNDHDVGVIRGRSLFKASVRFAEHRSQALCKMCECGDLEGQLCDGRSITDIFGKRKRDGFFLFVFEETTLRDLERKATRIDLDGVRKAIFESASLGGELKGSRAVGGDHTGRIEEGFALFWAEGNGGGGRIFEEFDRR